MNSTDFQDLIDLYVKENVKRTNRIARVAFRKWDKKRQYFLENSWPKEKQNIHSLYYALKAIHIGANTKLPLTTLALIGELATDPYYRPIIDQILRDNALSYKSTVWKLDDYSAQERIQKAFKTKQMTKVENFAA